MTESACDRCFAPGRCCSNISLNLNGGTWPLVETALEVYVLLARAWTADPSALGNAQPLMPLFRRPDGRWIFWCPALTREGRCGDYENRPGMCRVFEPMSDQLCVLGPSNHRRPEETVCEKAPQADLAKIALDRM